MYRPAGFWIRFGAALLDGFVISAVFGFISFLLFGNLLHPSRSFINLLIILYHLFLPVLWSGYIIGKRAAGIRIVKLDGSNVTFSTMLLRVLVSGLVYTVTFGIGIIVSAVMVGIRNDKRAIHDLIAGTYVTYAKPDEQS